MFAIIEINPQSKEVTCYQSQGMERSAHQSHQPRSAGRQDRPVNS